VLAVGQRVSRKILEQVKRVAKYDHDSFVYVVNQLLVTNLLSRTNDLIVPGLKLQPELAAYGVNTLEGQLESHVKQFIEEIHPHSDVVTCLRADLARNLGTLRLAVKELLELVPNEVVIVGDTKTAFDDEALMNRMVDTFTTLDSLPKEDVNESKQPGK
jgi:hypothetical protein